MKVSSYNLHNVRTSNSNWRLLVFIQRIKLHAVATPQDKIIEQLEKEILTLKTDLRDVNQQNEYLQKKFDELKVILRKT